MGILYGTSSRNFCGIGTSQRGLVGILGMRNAGCQNLKMAVGHSLGCRLQVYEDYEGIMITILQAFALLAGDSDGDHVEPHLQRKRHLPGPPDYPEVLAYEPPFLEAS